MQQVAGVFPSRAAAEEAMHALEAQGVSEQSISLLSAESQILAKGPQIAEEKRSAAGMAQGICSQAEASDLSQYRPVLTTGKSILIVHPQTEEQASVTKFVFETYESDKLNESGGELRYAA